MSGIMSKILPMTILSFMIVFSPWVGANAGNKKVEKPQNHETTKTIKSKTTDIPEHILNNPNWIMLNHVEEVFKLMKAGKGNCDRILNKTLSYINKHKAEILALRRQAEKLKSSLCPKAKKKAEAIIFSRAENLGNKYGDMMFDFYKKCPEQAERYVSAMQILGSKCKE